MNSRVSSKNTEKNAKRRNSIKKGDQTEKKTVQKKQEMASPVVEPGLSTRASNSLTTAPQ